MDHVFPLHLPLLQLSLFLWPAFNVTASGLGHFLRIRPAATRTPRPRYVHALGAPLTVWRVWLAAQGLVDRRSFGSDDREWTRATEVALVRRRCGGTGERQGRGTNRQDSKPHGYSVCYSRYQPIHLACLLAPSSALLSRPRSPRGFPSLLSDPRPSTPAPAAPAMFKSSFTYSMSACT